MRIVLFLWVVSFSVPVYAGSSDWVTGWGSGYVMGSSGRNHNSNNHKEPKSAKTVTTRTVNANGEIVEVSETTYDYGHMRVSGDTNVVR